MIVLALRFASRKGDPMSWTATDDVITRLNDVYKKLDCLLQQQQSATFRPPLAVTIAAGSSSIASHYAGAAPQGGHTMRRGLVDALLFAHLIDAFCFEELQPVIAKHGALIQFIEDMSNEYFTADCSQTADNRISWQVSAFPSLPPVARR